MHSCVFSSLYICMYLYLFFSGFDKDMLISFLSVDLNCLKGHMAFFLNFISELIAEVDSESIFCVLEHLT